MPRRRLAGLTRLELATFRVTGERSNQLSYSPRNQKSLFYYSVHSFNDVSAVAFTMPCEAFYYVLRTSKNKLRDASAETSVKAEAWAKEEVWLAWA
jgi:hypothetical protein